MESAKPQCSICSQTLNGIFGKKRCALCNYQFCKNCVIRRNYKMSDRICLRKYCLCCYFTMEISKVEKSQIFIEDYREKNLPNEESFLNEEKAVLSLLAYDPREDFEFCKTIGRGSFSLIWVIRNKTTGFKYALKQASPKTPDEKRLFLSEFVLTMLSNHENIIKYFKIYEYTEELFIVQEKMKCNLADLLSTKEKMPPSIASYLLREILKGLAYIHSKRRIHRDIKSDNILLDLRANVKIADLGFAVQLTDQKTYRNSFAGSPCWIAPEIIKGEFYNTKVDIWSLGVIAIELFEGEPPHIQKHSLAILNAILTEGIQPKHSALIPVEFMDFINSCLIPDPNLRSSAFSLLNHPALSSPASVNEVIHFIKERLKSKNS